MKFTRDMLKLTKEFNLINNFDYYLLTNNIYKIRELLPTQAEITGNHMFLISSIEMFNIFSVHINKLGDNDRTALMKAIYDDNEDLIKLLINHPKIDVNLQNNDGYTPLTFAIVYNKDLTLIKQLLNYPKIDVNSQNQTDDTSLTYAIAYNKDLTELILLTV